MVAMEIKEKTTLLKREHRMCLGNGCHKERQGEEGEGREGE